MQSKNKKTPTAAERDHIASVARLDCSVCDATGPSEVHEIKQGEWFVSVAVCTSCHRGPLLGWHGQRQMWKLKKMDELDALAVTIRRILKTKPAVDRKNIAHAAMN